MRDLANQRESECEHMYTTQRCCVAAQTRPAGRVSSLQKLTGALVGPRIAAPMLNRSGSDTWSIAIGSFRTLSRYVITTKRRSRGWESAL